MKRVPEQKLSDNYILKPLLRVLKNKFFIFTAIIVVWMVFFDRYNLGARISDTRKRNKMEADRDYYNAKAEEARKAHEELFSNEEQLEKFAREKYYMKKDSEDVFIVEE